MIQVEPRHRKSSRYRDHGSHALWCREKQNTYSKWSLGSKIGGPIWI